MEEGEIPIGSVLLEIQDPLRTDLLKTDPLRSFKDRPFLRSDLLRREVWNFWSSGCIRAGKAGNRADVACFG